MHQVPQKSSNTTRPRRSLRNSHVWPLRSGRAKFSSLSLVSLQNDPEDAPPNEPTPLLSGGLPFVGIVPPSWLLGSFPSRLISGSRLVATLGSAIRDGSADVIGGAAGGATR